MRLFSALWVPAGPAAALLADGADTAPPPGLRAVAVAGWHVTLAFHGEADPGVLARQLDTAGYGAPAPVLRLAGAGWSRQGAGAVCWAGVQSEPGGPDPALLARLAGGDPAPLRAHVTVWRARRAGRVAEPVAPWSAHRGPWWTPAELVLAASEPVRSGRRYRVVHRVPLQSAGEPCW